MLENIKHSKIILASKSPRRKQLLKGLEIDFEIRTLDVDEVFPTNLKGKEIPEYLAKLKADAFLSEIKNGEIVITADTVVWINDHVLNKPANREEAIVMISELSGAEHQVFTGVCITSLEKQLTFSDETKVQFTKLNEAEIEHYVDHYQPYDKAGAYGAQDWIGYVGISKLNGSYFNVMGLPVHLLYEHLKQF